MNLKQLARENGTNLKQIAEKCGIPPTTLYAISRGDTNFDNVGISIAIKVAVALNMTVEELYTGKKREYSAVELTIAERELINLYRSMAPEYKEMMIKNAAAYVAITEKNRAGNIEDARRTLA